MNQTAAGRLLSFHLCKLQALCKEEGHYLPEGWGERSCWAGGFYSSVCCANWRSPTGILFNANHMHSGPLLGKQFTLDGTVTNRQWHVPVKGLMSGSPEGFLPVSLSPGPKGQGRNFRVAGSLCSFENAPYMICIHLSLHSAKIQAVAWSQTLALGQPAKWMDERQWSLVLLHQNHSAYINADSWASCTCWFPFRGGAQEPTCLPGDSDAQVKLTQSLLTG